MEKAENRELVKYGDLVKRYSNPGKITYQQLLNTTEWHEVRSRILARDHHACRECNRRGTARFSVKKIQEVFKIHDKKPDWRIVGSELKLPNSVSAGHYWMFSSITLEKFRAAYWDLKYLTLKNNGTNFVLIKSSKPYHLQVHHRHYIIDNLPWEYPDNDLQTLCNWCHCLAHKNGYVNFYRKIDGELVKANFTPCEKCHGAGWLPQYEHIEDGICFRCQGLKFDELIPKRYRVS